MTTISQLLLLLNAILIVIIMVRVFLQHRELSKLKKKRLKAVERKNHDTEPFIKIPKELVEKQCNDGKNQYSSLKSSLKMFKLRNPYYDTGDI